jgi:hypothetical protein
MTLQNVRNFIPSYTASLPKGNESTATLREPQIVHRLMVFRYDVATGSAVLYETTTLASICHRLN